MKKKSSSKDSGSDIKNSAIELASAGLTMEKAEEYLMLAKGALKKLAIRSAEFSKRFLNAELTCCIEIEKALVRKAKGYDSTEITEIYVPVYPEDIPENSIPKLKLKEVRHVKKYIPPDNTAAVYILNNRRPERWSKNPETQENNLSYEEFLVKHKEFSAKAKANI